MLIATFSILQLLTGVLLARPYDPRISHYFPWAVLYPIVYWVFMSVITAISTPAGFFKKNKIPARWRSIRS